VEDVPTIVIVLRALDELPNGATLRELCQRTRRSRATILWTLRRLRISRLVRREARKFGRPALTVLTSAGFRAAQYARALERLLLTGDGTGGDSGRSGRGAPRP